MNITEETIDSFLRGDLNNAEVEAFNKAVAADPKLQQEVSIQKEIIDSVKQYRHQQLKDRLNAIEVKPVGFGGFFASPYVKLAASVGVVTLIVGAFALFNTENEHPTAVIESNVLNNTSVTAPSETKSTQTTSPKTNTESETASNLIDKKVDAVSATASSSKAVGTSANNSKSQNKVSDVTHTDLSEEPLDTDNTIDGITDNFDMPTMNHGGNTSNISSPQSVKVSIVKENNLGYRFFNNQLFLHGNFSNSTYELYELNNKPSKQLFLYFENNYYELIQGKTKVTALTPITDKAILLQLTQLREH